MDTSDLDLRATIADHPIPVLAGALLAGALVGLRGSHARRVAAAPTRGRLAALAISLAGTIAMRVVREVAMHQLAKYAKERFAAPEGRRYAHASA